MNKVIIAFYVGDAVKHKTFESDNLEELKDLVSKFLNLWTMSGVGPFLIHWKYAETQTVTIKANE
jgi:hypothetical protein